jgi:cell division protein FtsB
MEKMSKTIEISVYDLQELRNENKNLKEKVEELEGERRRDGLL